MLLRLPGLGDALDHDEAYTWEAFASRSLSTMTTHYPVPNNHIFHTLLVHASTALFGEGELPMRLPALLAGLLAIPATWWLARAVPGAGWVPVLAAWVVALSPDHASWSQVARGYTLIVLFSAICGGALLRAQLSRERVWWPVYALTLFLAIYTQPSAALLGVGLGAWSLGQALRSGQRPVLTSALAAHGAVGVALLVAYAPILERVIAAGRTWGIDLHAGSFVAFGGLLADVARQTGVVVLILAVLGAVCLRRQSAHVFWLFAGLLIAAFGVPLVHGVAPQPRGYLFLLPWFATIAAIGAGRLAAGRRRTLIVVALLLSLGLFSGLDALLHRDRPGWRDLGQSLTARTLRGEIIVAPFRMDVEVQYYARAAIERGVVTALMDGAVHSLLWATDEPRYTLDDYPMSTVEGQPQRLHLALDAFDKVYESGSRAVYRLQAVGQSMMPDSWQWNAHPEEVDQVEFAVAGPAVSQRTGLAVRNGSGGAFRLFSEARFRPPGPGICVLLSARTDPHSSVSLYRTDPDTDPGQIEQVTELSMSITAAKPVQGVGRDQRLWQMEAYLLPVDAASDYGVLVRGSAAPRQDFCDISVLFFPYP